MAFFVQGRDRVEAPSTFSSAMGALGSGISKGVELTLADKLDQLKEDKKIKRQRAANEYVAQQAEKSGMPNYAKLARVQGVDAANDYVKTYGLPDMGAFDNKQTKVPQALDSDTQNVFFKKQKSINESNIQDENASQQPLETSQIETSPKPSQFQPTYKKPYKTFIDYANEAAAKYGTTYEGLLPGKIKDSIGKTAEKREKSANAIRKENAPFLKKEIDSDTALNEKLNNEEMALNDQEIALQSGDIGNPFVNWFSEKTGLESLKTPSATLLKRASKENIMSNIKDVTAKAANQWLEKQLVTAYANVLYSPESNWILHESQKTNHDIGRKKSEIFNQLYDIYKDDPQTLQSEKNKLIRDYAEGKLKQLRTKIELIKKSFKPVKPGTSIPNDLAEVIYYQEGYDKKRAKIRTRNLGYDDSEGI